jgi:hypothetical protein
MNHTNPGTSEKRIAGSTGDLQSKTKPTPTEFAEAYLAGIRENGVTGTFLTAYRNGRPVRIREVNNLQ